jgi:transcription elongation factor Elf1
MVASRERTKAKFSVKGKIILCPNCGKKNSAEANFCYACGEPLLKEIKPSAKAGTISCPNCGQKNLAEANYCFACGEPLWEEIKKRLEKSMKIVALSLAAAGLALVVYALASSSSPALATNSYYILGAVGGYAITLGLILSTNWVWKRDQTFRRKFASRRYSVEQRVLEYIKSHGVVVNKDECLKELKITETQLKAAIDSLKKTKKLCAD